VTAPASLKYSPTQQGNSRSAFRHVLALHGLLAVAGTLFLIRRGDAWLFGP
jgi:hypothetical protein